MNEPDERTGPSPRAVSQTQFGFDEEEPPGKPRRKSIWRDVPANKWKDWWWQSPNMICSLRQLRSTLTFSPKEPEPLEEPESQSKLVIPPSYFSLINPQDPNDPKKRGDALTQTRRGSEGARFPSLARRVCVILSESLKQAPLEDGSDSPLAGLNRGSPDHNSPGTTHVCTMPCHLKRATIARGIWEAARRDHKRMRAIREFLKLSSAPGPKKVVILLCC
jgi:lysine 2,3-aminomutase